MSSTNRIALVIIAFLIAGLAADITLAIGVMASDMDADRMERIRFFAAAFLNDGYGPAVALAGAVTGIVVGEVFNIRSVLYYAAAAALIGFVASYSVDLSDALENTTDIAPVAFPLTTAAVAGLVGGLVYWLIAGRHSAKQE
jgi:hypothetical protein